VDHLTKRERVEAIVFYAGTAFLTFAWWLWLVEGPRHVFFGHRFGREWAWLLIGPDAASAVVGAGLLCFLLVRRSGLVAPLAWCHFGAQGYAWLISAGLALHDPAAYYGFVCMTFSAGVALALAIRLGNLNVLWGPFQFRASRPQSASGYWRRSLIQTAVMWVTFLGLIPAAIAGMELAFGWNLHWWHHPARVPVATLLFAIGGSLGLWAGRTMARTGCGTPLPSACAAKLVTDGPYAFLRNPMAAGGILQAMAVGLLIGSPLVVLYAVIGAIWWEIIARGCEEAYLRSVFGSEFDAYQQRVRCWVPSLRARDLSAMDSATHEMANVSVAPPPGPADGRH